jgi:signal transduction histidine kinase
MRALLLALRPESLRTEGLVAALGKLADALGARYQLQVRLEAEGEPDVPLEVNESLYRIAQEALNNIARHAGAGRVDVRLASAAEGLSLQVADDGAGFDTSQQFPGHLGLHTMRERAEKAGGTFAIRSAPGSGTRIQVKIPTPAR